jgi:excisionase family DNA binding protein
MRTTTPLLTTAQVAAVMGVSTRTVARMVTRGELKPAEVKPPRGYRFDPATMRRASQDPPQHDGGPLGSGSEIDHHSRSTPPHQRATHHQEGQRE